MERFNYHVVMITGAANGIGKACAHRFAQEGANIVCIDINDESNNLLKDEIERTGRKAMAISCDVRDAKQVEAAVNQLIEKWGRVDTLVCAAGVYSGAPLDQVDQKQWSNTIEINLSGVFFSNKFVAPIMKSQKSGSIINLSSMAGKTSWPASAEYSASKSGVIGLTRSIAMELAVYGVTVNALCPGNTLTEMLRGVAENVGAREGMSGEEWLEMRSNDCPMKRIGEPWEIAGVVAFLASEDSRFLTGQAIEVDGGMIVS